MKEILVVSHCILNNASKVAQDESELAEEYRERDELIRLVNEKGIQMIQLPCPEFIMYGAKRWGHVKDQFDNPFFKAGCRDMLEPVLMQLEEYSNCSDRFKLTGIVAVEGSPSCGINLTCRADWGGEIGEETADSGGPANEVRLANEPGVFMEVLASMLSERNLDIPIISIAEAASRIRKQ